MKARKGQSGFTLVELMIVAIIVAILAAVAIPLMSANKSRARATEAEAGLGTVRSCLRAMLAETGAYNKRSDGTTIVAGSLAVGNVSGLKAGDLNGRWFSDESYKASSITASNYVITCTGSDSMAAQKADVAGVVVTINQDGDFTRTGL